MSAGKESAQRAPWLCKDGSVRIEGDSKIIQGPWTSNRASSVFLVGLPDGIIEGPLK